MVLTRLNKSELIAAVVAVQIHLYPVIPVAKEKLVDTNGAGDAFVGGRSLNPAYNADKAGQERIGAPNLPFCTITDIYKKKPPENSLLELLITAFVLWRGPR